MSAYDELSAQEVAQTAGGLTAAIRRDLPDRGLVDLSARVEEVVATVSVESPAARREIRSTRRVSQAVSVVVVLAAVTAFVLAVRAAVGEGVEREVDWLPLLESTINDLVFAGIAVFFLWSLPERVHRRKLLALLHRLRSLAHVIDMHQLSKDGTPSPTDDAKTPLDERSRVVYLRHCSELLSLVAKTAALVAEQSRDAIVLDTVGRIEQLTANLSTKIWQKITWLDQDRG